MTAAPRTTAPDTATVGLDHACEPVPSGDVSGTPPSTGNDAGRRGSSRLIGIDAARGVALFGMMAVHIFSPVGPDGGVSLAWSVASGKSAALFALLAGVGVAFGSGRRRPPRGRAWTANAASLAVRALLIAAVGLLLGYVVPRSYAGIILPYYALLFVLAIPLLGLSIRWLLITAAAIGIGMPILSHLLRAGLERQTAPNHTFTDVFSAPGQVLAELSLTGTYPALPWLAYLCVGMAVGRAMLNSRRVVVTFTLIGVALAAGAQMVSWLLLDVFGGRTELEATALRSLSAEQYNDLLLWGPNGVTPSDSAWWLATVSPHSSTPLDLAFTIGTSLAVLGVAILIGRTTTSLLRPIAAAGSMTLTLYALHLLMLSSPFVPDPDSTNYLVQVLLVVGFALAWSRSHTRGPLEDAVATATGAVRRRVLGAGPGSGPSGPRPEEPATAGSGPGARGRVGEPER